MNEREKQLAVEVGLRIRRRRLAEGMTQKELGTRASLHRTTIISIENGKSVMHVHTFVQIAGGLGVSPIELAAGIEWVPRQPAPAGQWRFEPPPEGPGS